MAIIGIAVVCSPLSVHAEGATTDWSAGLVIAHGIGVANRAAPTPAAARGPARRAAEDAARRQILAALPSLPLATGGTFAAKLKDARVKAAIDAALVSAITLAADPQTDGSWKVQLALPLEAIRQATNGARTVTTSDEALAVVVVEAVATNPAIGFQIGGLAAASVWAQEVPTWARDAPRVKAKSVSGGKIAIELPRKATTATLFVLVK